MKKAQLVLVPSPGIGHLVSAIEFAKRLLDQDESFLITVLVIKAPFGPDRDNTNRSLITTIDNRIKYINLPQVTPPDLDPLRSPENYVSTFMEAHKLHVRDAVINHVMSKKSVPIVGLIVDLFCASMIEVAKELGISSYVYFASSAASLGLMLYLPTRQDQVGIEFKETDPDLIVPCFLNPVPARVMPSVLLNKDGGYICFEKHGRRFKEAKGIIVNTFTELESHAVSSFLGGDTPPVYTVGPLLNVNGQSLMGSDLDQHGKIMEWLDDQPENSVVFLCFGSIGRFEQAAQVKEIALGLEQSGLRFLWSIRKPPPEGQLKLPSDYLNYEEVLPNGFLERTKNIGMVCGWTPQMQVLAHKAIGGFVSHCGWNSILESLWFGVPVVTWPMYAEQQINAFEMVEDLGLAVEMTLDYRMRSNDIVLADKIAKSVKCVMEEDSEMRNKVKAMSEISRKAVTEGGSSFAAFGYLIENMFS